MQFLFKVIVGVISDVMVLLEGVEVDWFSGFFGDLLMYLIFQDQVCVILYVFLWCDELFKVVCCGDVDIIMSVVLCLQYDYCFIYLVLYFECFIVVVVCNDNM